MSYFGLHRIAAYLLLFFCAGHTLGGMLSNKSFGPESDAVFTAMTEVHFRAMGADCTWRGFWLGLGLNVSVYLLFAAVLAFYLGGAKQEHHPALAPVAWMLFASMVPVTYLSWKYFFVGPGVISTVVTLLLGVAALRY